jgi:cell wall-associated NlpC family hydrolase
LIRSLILPIAILALLGSCCGAIGSQALTLSLEAPSLGSPPREPAPKAESVPVDTVDKPAQSKTVKVGLVGMVQVPKASIYASRSATSRKYFTVKSQTPLAIVKEEGNWCGVLMVNGAVGWIARDAVSMTGYELLARKPEPIRSVLTSRGGVDTRGNYAGNGVVRTALGYSGVPYVFGGSDLSSGMDCSAFVKSVFERFSIHLPRTAREQAQVGATVPFDQLQPGDRLYFSCKNPYVDHCGIYAGSGYFVHCSASRNGVAVDTLASDFYWRSLVVAKRS